MQVQVHFSFTNEEEFLTFSKKFSGVEAATVVLKTETVKSPTAKPPGTLKSEPKQDAKAEPEKTETKKSETPSIEPTFDNVKEWVLRTSRDAGRDAAVAVLGKFGAKKVGADLKEEDYPAIIEACQEALAA